MIKKQDDRTKKNDFLLVNW